MKLSNWVVCGCVFLISALSCFAAPVRDLHYLVVDRSESIDSPNALKGPITEAVKKYVNTLPDSAELRIVFFNHEASRMKSWWPMNWDNKLAFMGYFAKEFKPAGQTRLYDTISEVITEVSAVSSNYNSIRVMVLSDGEDNKSTNNKGWDGIETLAGTLKHDNENSFIIWYTIGKNFVPKNLPRGNMVLVQAVLNTKDFTISPAPVADFAASPSRLEIGQSVEMKLLLSPGKIEEVVWDFGDGTPKLAQRVTYPYSVQHKFNKAGGYSVTLTAIGPGGTNTITKANLIEVAAAVPVKASFSWEPKKNRMGEIVQLMDKSEGQPSEFQWKLGEYGVSTNRAPSFTPDVAGTVNVSLTVRRDRMSDTTNQTIQILARLPVADFTVNPVEAAWGQVVTLCAVTTDPDVKDEWAIGNVTRSGRKVEWTADQAGMVKINHTASSSGGSVDKPGSVYVKLPAAPVDFLMEPNPVEIDGEVSIHVKTDAPGWKHEWVVDGATLAGGKAMWRASKAGSFSVIHRVVGFGQTNSLPKELYVKEPVKLPPFNPDFSVFPAEVQPGDTVVLDAKDGDPACEHIWVVGSERLTGKMVKFKAVGVGVQPVVHQIPGSRGGKLEKTYTVLESSLPTIKVTVHGKYPPVDVECSDLTKGVVGRVWSFSDGTTVKDQNPVRHTFGKPGTYTVDLAVRNAGGQEKKLEKPVSIVVKAPIPLWVWGATAVGIILLAGLIGWNRLKPLPLYGTLKWDYRGEEGVRKLGDCGTSLVLADLGIEALKNTMSSFVIQNRKSAGMHVKQSGDEPILLADKTKFRVENVNFEYRELG